MQNGGYVKGLSNEEIDKEVERYGKQLQPMTAGKQDSVAGGDMTIGGR